MTEKLIKICDMCNKKVAINKCCFCQKDVCEDCLCEEVVGTVQLIFCKNCFQKIDRVTKRINFWKEFNENNNIKTQVMDYLNKKLILNNFADVPEEGEEGEVNWNGRNKGRIRIGGR